MNQKPIFFYVQQDIEDRYNDNKFYSAIYDYFKSVCIEKHLPVYIVNKVLSKLEYQYSKEVEENLDKICAVLIPAYKILLFRDVNLGDDVFEQFKEEFWADINSLADKFEYTKNEYLGRITQWKKFFEEITYNEVDRYDEFKITDFIERRKVKAIISLIIDSQNEADRIFNLQNDSSLVEKVKSRIRIFDGEQTRFLFNEPNKSVIKVQGLSGSGKTELLLHKIKRFYEAEKESTLVLTCHNRVLAHKLEERIDEFFDFMGVRNKNRWRERIFVGNAWGGFYKKICNENNLRFYNFREVSSFDNVCKIAYEELSKKREIKKYDYIFIDESQDLPLKFFKLCELVANKKVYIVGDIFQDIFGNKIQKEENIDFTLKESYRTNPRTLMFAQAIGLGLFEREDKFLDCLKGDEWKSCGYEVEKISDENYLLKRKEIPIFDEEEKIEDSFEVNRIKDLIKIKERLTKLLNEYEDIELGDIAIIVLFRDNNITYKVISMLEETLTEMNLDYTIGYRDRVHYKNKVFLTNQNNVKGLEFPFVICISDRLSYSELNATEIRFRNALYMSLSRSFIKTFWLTTEDEDYLNMILTQEQKIKQDLSMQIRIPKKCEEIKQRAIKFSNFETPQSFREFLEEIYDELQFNEKKKAQANKLIYSTPKFMSEDFQKLRDKEEIKKFLQFAEIF